MAKFESPPTLLSFAPPTLTTWVSLPSIALLMKRFSLFAVALLLFVSACTDATSPTTTGLLAPTQLSAALSGPGNIPPPPISGFLDGGGYAIPVMYFLNPTGNTGFIRFLPNANYPAGVSASPDARIMYSQGSFSGRGTLTIGTATIDLSTASFAGSNFTSCSRTCGSLFISQGSTQQSFAILPSAPLVGTSCETTCETTGGDEGLITGRD